MSKKILIIDDEPATVEMIGTFMEINGYGWSSALNGTQGLALIQTDKPDLLILDLMMPDIEGFEICEWVRSQEAIAQTPIIIVSARTDEEAMTRAEACGANSYITKPFNLQVLLNEIQTLLA